MDVVTSSNIMTITAKKSGKYIRKSIDRWSGYNEVEYDLSAGDVIYSITMDGSYNPTHSIYAV